ncbi:MAG: hypothetical protein JWR16_1594 [Nevskia sp.]|nr:hypothetical protein [Nevskia sp.]
MLSGPLGRSWRVLGTGFSFIVFGVSALLLSVTVCPLLALTAPSRAVARARIQRALHYGCRFFVGLMKTVGVISYELHGIERLAQAPSGAKGRLILANHPSLIDAVFLLAWTPQAVCIVKQALKHNPFLSWTVNWSGYVSNDTPMRLIQSCVQTLDDGQALIMFPEGTRSVPGQALEFKRGAAWIALRSEAEILPVVIRCEPIMLTKGRRWYQVPPRPGHFTIVVGEPMPLASYRSAGSSPAQAAARLTQQLQRTLDPQRIGCTVAAPVWSLR